MKNLLLRACISALALLAAPVSAQTAFNAGKQVADTNPQPVKFQCWSGSAFVQCSTPPAAPTSYPLLTAATPSPAATPPAGDYNVLFPPTLGGSTFSVAQLSNGSTTTRTWTAAQIAAMTYPPCIPVSAGDIISASVTGGTPTGNTVFAGATRCGPGDVSPAAFTQAALVASGKTAVTGTLTATGTSAAFTPIAGRAFNVTISGGVAVCEVDRSFDAGSTWFVALSDSIRTSIPESFTLSETEAGVQYRANCTGYTSGTVTYRLSM